MEQELSQPRTIGSPDEARVVETLETGRQRTLTLDQIASIIGAPKHGQRARDVAALLRRHGWIRALPLRGTYEFQPAAGGAFSSGDPWLEFRLATTRDPSTQAHVGLGSAAFLRGFADRRPLPDTVVWSLATRPPESLASLYRIIRVRPERFFGTELLDGLPVATPERIALEAATWPSRAGDLRNPDHWLRAVLHATSIDGLVEGATRLGPATTARLGYLAHHFDAESVASALSALPHTKPVWIGSRDRPGKRFDERWGVYDTVGVGGIE